jgi:hemerythrin-like domain-containing protein
MMAGPKEPGAMTREMTMVHIGFLREFFLMPGLVRGVPDGDRVRVELVTDHVGMLSFGLHHHHHAEDMGIWPRLLERAPDEVQPLVHGMERHHERIAASIDELTKEIAAWRADPSAVNRDAVANTLDGLLPVLREHLDEEVAYVLPIIEKHITADEWDATFAQGLSQMPPGSLPLVMGLMMYEGDPLAVQDALNNVPEQARSAVAEAAPKAYAEYAERLYGTATPPHGYTLIRR